MNFTPPVIREDLANHFLYGALTFAVTSNLAASLSPHWAHLVGFTAAGAVAVLREFVWGSTPPSLTDIAFTLLGAATVLSAC